MKISDMIRADMREAAAPLSAWVSSGEVEINAREPGRPLCKEAAKTLLKLDQVLQKALDQVTRDMKAEGIKSSARTPPSVGSVGMDYATASVSIEATGSDGKSRWLPDEIKKMEQIVSKVAKLRDRPEYHG